ncbi:MULTISPECIES: MalY/PatB family protein [unclassified Sedimentibacter]|uniref:MalY/PatB family protein n=1 Tax=unclassified Sedimentibacter TaxID=2649220 RepID=UPI0027E1A2B0|nr:aminotransferase class I/II-fold pyridoxal phosphate-dependent enzyme [Sedimentibacter sp. MB35-C1]WMJ77669.1 aminotransferase class I/II-fold pyridoxal phosphate-dependent enzyme [Sedimentibacter sp. MB35-C1]
MKYDFTSIIDRQGKDAIAVDLAHGLGPGLPKEGFDVIPMWVADMNFPALPAIQEAIIERVKHPMFGYFLPRQEYFDSIINWQEKRNGVTGLEAKHIGYENGVLGCVMSAIDSFSAPGDYVLLHSPTYIGFTKTLENSGRRIIHSDLVQDEEGVWRMDYEDMEAKIKAYKIHAAIFCSPHNPCGRVWERKEIEMAMEIYKRNDCIVISDEIWSDITLYGNKHIPTQSVSEDAKNRTIAVYAPSKTFNLAGLIGAYHIIYSNYLRDRVRSQSGKSHYNSMNVLSMHALIGAYKPEGHEWVEELREVIAENVDYAYKHIVDNYKGVKLFKPQGTYMLYLECEEWCSEHNMTLDELYKAGTDVGVSWQDGRPFNHSCTLRMNLALPKSRVIEAFDRLDKYVFNVNK